jgi:hypothetical protein
MLSAGVPAPLEDVEKANDIAVDVHMRILERVAHAGLGREMDDALRPFALEELCHSPSVGNVELDEPETGLRCKLRQPGLLQGNIVVVVEIVQPENVVAANEEPLRDMHSDESRCSRDEDFQMTVS